MRGEKAPMDREYKGLKKNGAIFWVSCRAFLINWDGELVSCNIRIDITDKKVAQQELQKSEKRFRVLFNEFKQGILVHRHRKVLFVNQAFADIYATTHRRKFSI